MSTDIGKSGTTKNALHGRTVIYVEFNLTVYCAELAISVLTAPASIFEQLTRVVRGFVKTLLRAARVFVNEPSVA